ncbi:MAG: hypothetical protein ABSB25_02385 [Sedimentisphaerales bacterium]
MTLMVWFRKHNRKIMAFVVIALMIVFTIEPLMNYFSSARTGEGKTIAYYGNDRKITRQDVALANQQIEALKALGLESVLRPVDPRQMSSQDMRSVLLGELIFPERSAAVESIGRIKQIATMDDYEVSDNQINEIYTKQYPPSIYWVLLTKEAEEAGIKTSTERAKEQLEVIIPRIFQGRPYSQIIAAIEKQYRLSEGQVLEAFAEMSSIINYCGVVCSTENITIPQILHQTNLHRETLDVNYVVFEAGTFKSESFKPEASKVAEQFDKYKWYFAGEPNKDNPYGFGYKLPERVCLEYITVRLDDVAATVNPLTQEETENYYQQHSSQPPIAYRDYLDPNDPNSGVVVKTHSYAEVASQLSKRLYQEKVDSKAEKILADAKSLTEINLSEMDSEKGKLTDEQFKKAAVDYAKVAAELTEKHKVPVYAGRTGLLGVSDIQSDKNFNSLYAGGAGVAEASLVRVLFSIEQLKVSELGPMDIKAPRLYENIGPLRDAQEMSAEGYKGRNMMLVRVVAAEKAAEPKSIDERIDRHGIQFEQDGSARADSNTIREIITDDLKLLAAMDKTKTRAQEFVALATTAGWKAAVERFNTLYGKNAGDSNTMPVKDRTFLFNKRSGLHRIDTQEIEKVKARSQGNPTARMILDRTIREGLLMDKVFALIPQDSNTLPKQGEIMEFKPGMCYYCLESATIHRLYQEVFDVTKASEVVRDEYADSQALAISHYSPKNIVNRMKYVQIKEKQDANAPKAEPNAVPVDINRAGK